MFSRLRSRIDDACRPRERVLAAAIALLAGIAVFAIASEVFPYHSSNHDEGVYLQQAQLLLDGQFRLFPGVLGDAVRPWFFVDGGDHFYPKYQPLPAGFYALSMALFGEPRVTLAAVAAGNTALVYVLGGLAFDRRVGLLAAAAFAVSPMALLTSSVFLPYATTTLFTLVFACAYLHSHRTGSRRTALLAGGAIGVAFFMRPFTALLFALPFLAHATWEILTVLRDRADGGLSSVTEAVRSGPITRQGATAFVGLCFVGAVLAYNATLTGSPLRFPYQAFAPMDGPGFGQRRILGHSIDYSPAVALRSNAAIVWYFLTRWVPAGLLGTACAIAGLLATAGARGLLPTVDAARMRGVLPGDTTPQTLLAGLFLTIPLGNIFFWGNYNVLANPGDPTDGFLGQFGPFYHFDLLAPVAIFGAAGFLACWRSRGALRSRIARVLPGQLPGNGRAIGLSLLLVAVLVLGGVNAALVTGPLDRNLAHTETYEDAYAPFEDGEYVNGTAADGDDGKAVVFLPTPYGDWLNHPYQYLRNDPGFDGQTVYALDRWPESDFAVIDAAPEREHYRYTFHGEWTADPDERVVIPRVEELSVRRGEHLAGETVVGVPAAVEHATVRLETDTGHADASVADPSTEIAVDWSLTDATATLEAVDGSAMENASVGLAGTDTVELTVRLSQSGAGTLTYRQDTAVRPTERGVEAIWPPERTVCPLVTDCGNEGTYLPDRPEHHFDGVSFDTSLGPAN